MQRVGCAGARPAEFGDRAMAFDSGLRSCCEAWNLLPPHLFWGIASLHAPVLILDGKKANFWSEHLSLRVMKRFEPGARRPGGAD